MDTDLFFETETSDMLSGTAGGDTQLAAASSADAPFADALARPFDAAQVVVPQGETVVREPVTSGEVVELPFPPDAHFLARIDNGNLAIKVGDVTVILQGYVEAAGQTPPVIEASNGQPLDIATILASTDPAIEIQTAAGPAAGAQGADNTGAILAQFAEGAGLAGFTGAGALDGTEGLGGGPVDQTGTLFRQFGDLTTTTNTAPTAFDEKETTNEDTAFSGKVTATDPEGDPLTYSVVGGLPAGVVFKADGTWSFDPSGKFDALNVGDTSTLSFQYKANDGTSDSNVATVTLNITGVNDLPHLKAGFIDETMTEDQNDQQSLGWVIKDPDDTKFTITVDKSTLPTGVTYDSKTETLHFNAKGNYDYLAAGESEHFTIKFTITDAHGGSVEQDVSLTINGVNDAPVAAADLLLTNNGNSTFDLPTWALSANDTDVDGHGQPLTTQGASWNPLEVSLALAADHLTVTDIPATLGGSFTYLGWDGAASTAWTNVTMTNQAGGDITGTGASEILIGSTNAEKLDGGGGNDIIIGRGGNDNIFGGAGDDTLVFSGGSAIHGGTDTIATKDGLEGGAANHGDVLAVSDLKLDFSDHASVANIDGIETISTAANVGGAGAQSLTIGAHSVQDLSDHTITPGGLFPEKDAVRVDGDAVDQLYLSISKDGGSWADTGVVSNGYHVFAHETTGGDATTTDAYVMVQTANVANVHLNQDAP